MKYIHVCLIVLSLAACGAPGPDESQCSRGVLEDDLRFAGEMAGPDVDAATGKLKPGNYILSSTYLKLALDAKGQKVFRDAMVAINQTLDTTEGLSAFQLATSEKCLTGRTLSVWKTEAAMRAFAASQAHTNAIQNVDAMSRGGGMVTFWTDTEAGATYEVSATKLGATNRRSF